MTARRVSGSALADAIVAAGLAGLAAASLAASAALGTRTLVLVRDTNNALAFAGQRLDALRSGPRLDGADAPVSADGTMFARRWTTGGGRGAPATLAVRVQWGGRTVALDTETLP
jgi:hypothetical protein